MAEETLFFPLFVKGSALSCLLVGGGNSALRKFVQLESSGVRVCVVALTINPLLRAKLSSDQVQQCAYRREHLSGVNLVVAATNNRQLNEEIFRDAQQLGVWCNVVDQSDLCDFIFPSILRRGELSLAIASDGLAPALSAWLRRRLAVSLPHWLGGISRLIKRQRFATKKSLPNYRERAAFYNHLLEHADFYQLATPQAQDAFFAKQLSAFAQRGERGHVWLVGAGAGEADLLTLKAAQVLGQADVVLHDSLVGDSVLELVRREAEVIDVGRRAGGAGEAEGAEKAAEGEKAGVAGKAKSGCSKRMLMVCDLMLKFARAGKSVVRLKGGDPLLFAGASEELQALNAARVPFSIVAGISAFSACAAAGEVLLTQRYGANELRILSAHNLKNQTASWWEQFKSPRVSWALYMGAGNFSFLIASLIQHNTDLSTEVVVVECGARKDQNIQRKELKQWHKSLYQPQTPAIIFILGLAAQDGDNSQLDSYLKQFTARSKVYA